MTSCTHDETPPATYGYVPSTSRQTSAIVAPAGSSAAPIGASAASSAARTANLSGGGGARDLDRTDPDRTARRGHRRRTQPPAGGELRREMRLRVAAHV